MPLKDIQQRGRVLGRIRIGAQVTFTKGNGEQGRRPVKLEVFRFTTPSRANADMVAHLFGGAARPWEERPGEFEVMTEATELPVMIPPGHPLTQHYELWSRGGIQRRCDGEQQQSGAPCVCPSEIGARMDAAATNPPAACKPMTRLSVVLPDLMDLGVWLVVSGGYNAAHELGGTADFLHRAATADHYLPAVLRLEQRTSTRANKTHHFAVPVLELRETIRALTSGEAFSQPGMTLPAAPADARAITSGPAPTPPPPDDEEEAVDAEIVTEPDDLAQQTLDCETVADVEALLAKARAAGFTARTEATHPISGARMLLRDILDTRWKELA